MTTLDEAIKHAEEVAKEKEAQAWEAQLQEEYEKIKSCKKCAEEHRQLAEWLKDYKRLLEQEPFGPCDLCGFNPPSSADGKPCTMCPAEKGE